MGLFAIRIKPTLDMAIERLADNSPWFDALAELRQRATREGHCYRPGNHRCDRSVRREGAGQPRLLSQQALRRRMAETDYFV